MKILRERERALRGFYVGWPGFEPGTSGLKVPRARGVSPRKYLRFPLSQSNQKTQKLASFPPILREVGRHGLYQIVEIRHRGKRELRYVRQ